MPSQPRPPLQHCPLCGVAMLGSKSDEGSLHFDTFRCLKCETVMTFIPPRKGPKPDR